MRLLWLPEVLRSAGLTVHEVGGWRTRGSASWSPRGIICHETRGSIRSTDAGEIYVLLHGSATAPPPIAQLYLSRTGHWHVIASGRCNHVRAGWAGPFKGVGNSGLIGIEAQHAAGEPWTDRQYDSYVRGVAALRARTGWGIAGHKEHQPGGYGHASSKTDPSFNMNQFRADVAAVLAGEDDEMTEAERYVQHVINYRVEALRANRPTIVIPAFGDRPAITEPNRLAEALAELAARPQVESAPVDVDQLAAALAPHLEAAAERAVRKVLGAVDGATPGS
jgi:hypothetical protein